MRKAAEVKLFDKNNVTFFIEKDSHSLKIIKQEPDPDSDGDRREYKHTTIVFTKEQAAYFLEALNELADIQLYTEVE